MRKNTTFFISTHYYSKKLSTRLLTEYSFMRILYCLIFPIQLKYTKCAYYISNVFSQIYSFFVSLSICTIGFVSACTVRKLTYNTQSPNTNCECRGIRHIGYPAIFRTVFCTMYLLLYRPKQIYKPCLFPCPEFH